MICLEVLLKVPSLSDLKVIGGYNGLEREISTVTLLDAPDGPKWLKGGEFVLTSAYIFNNNYQFLEEYIIALIKKNASGLGIKTGRFLSSIPEQIVEIAMKHQFPIIQIPYHLVWTDIIAPFYELKYGLYDHRKPIIIEPDMILPLYEASRWGGKRLLFQMTELFQMPIAIYKQDKTLIFNNGLHGVKQIEQAAKQLKVFPERRYPEKAMIDNYSCSFFCLPRSFNNEREYLGIASTNSEDMDEIQKLITLLENLSSKDMLDLKDKSDVYRTFLHKVIHSAITAEEITVFEESRAGSKKNIIYSGILLLAGNDNQKLFDDFQELLRSYQKSPGFKIETYFCDNLAKMEAVILLEIHSSVKLNIHSWIRSLIPVLGTLFTEVLKGTLAISCMSDSLKDIRDLYEQAQQSLRLGRLLFTEQHCHYFPDYSPYVLLDQNSLNQIDFEDCMLLLENKSTMSFQPLETAEAYIEYGNYKRAAAKLYIHENTLRYRINKINELLRMDLESPIEGHRFLTKIKLWKIYCFKNNIL